MSVLKGTAPGIGITLIISVISLLSASLHPSFDSLVISIIFGMLVSNMLGDREALEKGSRAALKVSLPIGIGFYGTQLTVTGASTLTLGMAVVVIGIIAFTFVVTYYISKGFGLDKDLSLLLSTGMSVCGASAIAVVGPLLNSKKENTTISILSIMTVGLTGMLVYRFMPQILGLSLNKFSFLAGSTLPMLGQVKVASSVLGPESLHNAVGVKLVRVSSLALFAGAAMFAGSKRLYVPWFMVMFFALALGTNLFPAFAGLKGLFGHVSTFALSASLAAIGLSIDFDSITEKGTTPLFAAFLSWGIVATTVYLALIITV